MDGLINCLNCDKILLQKNDKFCGHKCNDIFRNKSYRRQRKKFETLLHKERDFKYLQILENFDLETNKEKLIFLLDFYEKNK